MHKKKPPVICYHNLPFSAMCLSYTLEPKTQRLGCRPSFCVVKVRGKYMRFKINGETEKS